MLQFGFSQFCTVIMLMLMMPSFADSMKIKVIYDGEDYPVTVDEKDTVATLKAKIEKIEEIGKIQIQKQILTKKSSTERVKGVLADQKTMDEYGIGEGDTIYMEVVTDTYFFRIDVNYSSIKNIVWVKCTDTVKDLKKKIANFDKLGNIPIQKQVLFNENTESVLEDNKTMDEYGIGERGTIYMEVVACGGSNFHIHVNYGRKRITVLAKGTDTVKDLKKKIAKIDQLGNIPIQKQTLTKEIAGEFWIELADDEEIDKYAIGEGQNVFVSWNEFQLFVEYKEKMYPIKVKAMTTIKEVKEKMTEITRIPSEEQTISHFKYGKFFDNARLINLMKKEDTTFLIMSDGSGLTVEWQNHFWEFFVIYVNGTDTVATVKQKIREINKQRHKSKLNGAIKLSKCDFNCEFANALSDEKTMDEYGIVEGITIYMTKEFSPIMLSAGKKSSPPSSSAGKKSSPPSSSAAAAIGSKFHFHVKYGGVWHIIVWVKGTDTVQSMKRKIRPFMEKAFGCKLGDISLIKRTFRANIELADNKKTMNDYGIKEGDTFRSLDAEKLC